MYLSFNAIYFGFEAVFIKSIESVLQPCNPFLTFVFIVVFSCFGKPETKYDGTTIKYIDQNSPHHWYECSLGTPKRFECLWGRFDKLLQRCA